VSGKIGSGGAKITLVTDVGDVSIKRGEAFPPAPNAAPATPKAPAAPNAPHLKPSKALPAQPVTQ